MSGDAVASARWRCSDVTLNTSLHPEAVVIQQQQQQQQLRDA